MPFGRVGSNLLMDYICKALAGRALCGNQILTGSRDLKAQIQTLQDFYLTKSNHKFRVTKESLAAMPDADGLSEFLVKEGVSVIRMFRRSILKTAISQIRAEAYAELSKKQTGVAMWGVEKDSAPLGAFEIDIERLNELCLFIEDQSQRLSRMCTSGNVLDLYYEDFLSNFENQLVRVSEFMGFDFMEFEPRFRKATSDDLSQSVTNVDEVLASVPQRFLVPFALTG